MTSTSRLVAPLLALGLVAGSQALTLTGLNGFPTDTQGNWKIGWYNTYGPDGGKNGYVTMGSATGSFLNSGNSSTTQISVNLNTPGRYRFYAFFDGQEMGVGRETWGLNLFFDGDNQNPKISAFGSRQNQGDSSPGFQANSGMTLNLSAGQNVPGSGKLVYQSGGREVRLAEFATTNDIFALDRVNNFSLGASGRNDHVAVIALDVVPEPGTMAALGLGGAALLRRRRRRSKG